MIVIAKYLSGAVRVYRDISSVYLENGYYWVCQKFDSWKVPFYDKKDGDLSSFEVHNK